MAVYEFKCYDRKTYQEHTAKLLENKLIEVDGDEYTNGCFCYLFTTVSLSELERTTYEIDKI